MKQTLLLLLLLPVVGLRGQTLDRQIVGTAGGHAQTIAGTLDWSAGEMRINAYHHPNLYWGEGFQQAWYAPLVDTDDPVAALPVTVYPNPAVDYLFVATGRSGLHAQLFDLSGRPVTDFIAVNGLSSIDLGAQPAGFYFLRVLDDNGRLVGARKIQLVHF